MTAELFHSARMEALWQGSNAAASGLTREEFIEILAGAGEARNYGQPAGQRASPEQQAAFLESVNIADLVLARACAAGKPAAWERFMALYRAPLLRAACAIARNDTVGHDLCDSLWGELYGLAARNGQRDSPLLSYTGKGSLLGWLRTTLSQRFADHYRRTNREAPLDGHDAPDRVCAQTVPPLPALAAAVREAIRDVRPEDRFLLASYYLDGRRLRQIAQAVRRDESTISRRLDRLTGDLRKRVLRNLRGRGLSRRQAEEELDADPRDLDINLKELLQDFRSGAFPEKAEI